MNQELGDLVRLPKTTFTRTSTPPIDKEKRAFAARFFFLPITLPIGEDGMLWGRVTQPSSAAFFSELVPV